MTRIHENIDPFDDDPRVLQAFQSLAERLRDGEIVGEERIREEFPEFAETLIGVLPGLIAASSFGRRASADDGGELVGTRLGDYEVLGFLGRGGMGIVYEGRHIHLGRRVAIKVLPTLYALDPAARRRFLREAESIATLDHEHIVPIHEVKVDTPTPYFVMKCIDGPSLAELARAVENLPEIDNDRGEPRSVLITRLAGELLADRLRADRFTSESKGYVHAVARLGVDAADALEHAHQHGVIHRDVKPANFLIDSGGRLWLTDFGLAWIDRGGGTTLSAPAGGTPAYMSPEQLCSPPVRIDHRTDIYSLGITLAELLNLRTPGDRHSLGSLRPAKHGFVDPKRVPKDFRTILDRAAAEAAEDRFASAEAFAAQLRLFLEGRPLTIRPPSILSRVSKWMYRRRRPLAAWSALLLLILGLATALLFDEYRRGNASRAAVRAAIVGMSRRVEDLASRAPKDQETARIVCEGTLKLIQDAMEADPVARADGDLRYRLASLLYNHARLLRNFPKDQYLSTMFKDYDQSIAILRELVRDFPDHRSHAWFRHDLARAIKDRGSAQLLSEDPKRFDLKIQAHLESVAIVDSLARDFPDDLDWANVLAYHRIGLAESYVQVGRPDEGLRVCEEAERISLRLVALAPRDARYLRTLGSILSVRTTTLKNGNQFAEAEPIARRSAAISEEVNRLSSGDPTLRQEFVRRTGTLAEILRRLRRNEEAEPIQLKTVAEAEKLANDYPTNDILAADHWGSLADLAFTRNSLGKRKEAESDYRRAVTQLEQLYTHNPSSCRRILIEIYEYCPIEQIKNPTRALELSLPNDARRK